MNILRKCFKALYCPKTLGSRRTCFTLPAFVFLVGLSLHIAPGISSTSTATSSRTLSHRWTGHKAASEGVWNHQRKTKHPRRRHLKSRIARAKLEAHRNAELEILHTGLGEDRKRDIGLENGSDDIDEYKVNEVPAIWEVLRIRNSVKNQEKVPAWQRLPTAEDISRFKRLVQLTMACRKLPTLTLALVKDGHVVLRANLGYADPENKVPVSRNTRFAIGSLTKAFTSTLVSELLMERNLSLDTAINQLLPDTFQLMDEVRTRTVTVRDLLGHRTGVPGYFHALLMGFPAQVTRPELVSRLRYIPAVVPLRYQFMYNNYLYTLAAHVVEKLTSRRWEALLRDVILDPLGMRSTGFVDEVEDFGHFALPCALLNGTFKNLMPELLLSVSPCGPAGSIYSTAHDMARWLRTLLSNGKGPDGRQVLQEKALRETTLAVMPPPGIGPDRTKPDFPISDVEQSYGMGWITSNYRGYQKVWHSGGIVTYSSRLWLLPGVKAGLFVATNGPQTRDEGHALTAITNMAADLLLGERFWLNESTICTFPAPWKRPEASPLRTTPATSSAEDSPPEEPSHRREDDSPNVFTRRQESPDVSLDQLVGVYTHKAFGEIVIERERRGGGNDVKENDVMITDDKHGVKAEVTEGANASEWLMLKYGRFGQLRLKRKDGDSGGWEGWFVGPLWYVTASDENQSPIPVHFLKDARGQVDRIRYPIDGHYDDIEFQKLDAGVIASVPYSSSASCAGVSLVSAEVLKVGVGLFLLRGLVRPGQF